MKTLQRDSEPAPKARGLGRRLFARFGSPIILIVVLLVVVGWIGVLGGALTWLLGEH